VQAEIGGRLRDLQARHRLAWLVISHDLTMVHTLAHTAAVLMDGAVVEQGPTEAAMDALQPCRALMAAAFALEADERGVVRRSTGAASPPGVAAR
jgi:microcin C transport system ATP-binding protein